MALRSRSYEILFNNKLILFKRVAINSIHYSVLNPFFIYYDYEYYKDYSSKIIGDFVFGQKHVTLIPIRIFYSLLIYFICFVGLISCFKKNPKLSILLIISIMYYYLICGWYGKTRLFVPCLIYMSVFFGFGFNSIFNKIKILAKTIYQSHERT